MLKKIRSVAIYVVCSLTTTMATDALAIETGLASYYSDRFQGRKTASGEQYDRNKLTAAHRTLPIGSQIEVTNLENQSSVIVTVNDRGPYVGNRTLDLSYAAAKELGLVSSGVAPVTFNILDLGKNSDFEKVIPLEYSPGLAKSEEEVIEAEEELANSDAAADSSVTVTTEKSSKPSHKHKAKKMADTSENVSHHTSKSKDHAVNHSEKESQSKKTAKADKSTLKHSDKTHKVAKSDKGEKKHSKSKKA